MRLDGFLQRVAECNCSAAEIAQLVPFVIDTDMGEARTLGRLTPGFAAEIAQLPQFRATYDVENTGSITPTSVQLRPRDSSQKACTAALAEATATLRQAGTITGWRDELYPVTHAFEAPPAALIERAAAPYFGVKAYGVHINGYVRGSDGQLQLWVARRSRTKPTWPSLLDHIAAGGQPAGLSCIDNVVKECEEEASIPAALAKTARAVGAISYAGLTHQGFKTDVLFCYDLELPSDFQPQPQDGEVESFELLPIDEVARIIAESRDFKPNCCLVIIDFMIRHGVLTPDQAQYAELVKALHV
jgi:8-oxo-dGTP pyrophosphatase MutT (NUDIX family)